MEKKISDVPFMVILSTILVAFFCDIKTMNTYLAPATNSETGGPMAMLYLFGVLAIVFFGLFFRKDLMKNISSKSIYLSIYFLLFYVITVTFIGKPNTAFVYFGVFTLASFVLPNFCTIDVRLLLKCIMIFSVPALFHLSKIFSFVNSYNEVISMGISYSFLVPILSTIVYLFTYFKNESFQQKIITIVLTMVNAVFALNLILFGSRGPIFAMICTITYFLIVYYDDNKEKFAIKRGRASIVVVSIISIAMAFVPILELISFILDSQGISVNFIDKFLRMNKLGDMSNGRDAITDFTLNAIVQNPIFGHGFDQFERIFVKQPYPHNFILQILFDGGFFFFFILFIPLWKASKQIIKSCTYNEFVLYSTLFFISIPGAMFSGNLWKSGLLWLFFGAVLCRTYVYEKN